MKWTTNPNNTADKNMLLFNKSNRTPATIIATIVSALPLEVTLKIIGFKAQNATKVSIFLKSNVVVF